MLSCPFAEKSAYQILVSLVFMFSILITLTYTVYDKNLYRGPFDNSNFYKFYYGKKSKARCEDMSPRTKKQNEIIREQRKQEILQAAIHVYVTKGYSATTLSDIATQASLAHGLVYYYFKNKKGLFRELYECMMSRSLDYTTAYFEKDAPVLEQFQNYAQLICERVMKDPETQRFYMRISLDLHHLYEPGELSPFEWMKSFIKPMAQAIDNGIHQGVIRQGDAYLMAMQFWGAVSQGMTYLDQLLQDLAAQGLTETEMNKVISEKIQQIASSAVSFFKLP